jgi:hypothetical protein
MPISELLTKACPSTRSRVRREILGESRAADEVKALQAEILQDGAVKDILAAQDSDGWIFQVFHGYESMESAVRVLCEKDLDPENASFSKALTALKVYPDRLQRGIGKVGPILDDDGFGGSQTIRAFLLAQAGKGDSPLVQSQIPGALDAFRAVLERDAVEDFIERYRGKFVYRDGVVWPSIYHLRLLAFTESWHSPQNQATLAEAVSRLVKWSPLPAVYVRHRSQLIAPTSFGMGDFTPDLDALDDPGWMIWFQRMELLSRLGVLAAVPGLVAQADRLVEILGEGGGWFTLALSHPYFRKWGAYTGLMLEKDWRKPERRTYDLTFRSLLILNYCGFQTDCW